MVKKSPMEVDFFIGTHTMRALRKLSPATTFHTQIPFDRLTARQVDPAGLRDMLRYYAAVISPSMEPTVTW